MGKDFDYKKLHVKFGVPSVAGQKSPKAPPLKHTKVVETGTLVSIPDKE